jgi:hypothetical protein
MAVYLRIIGITTGKVDLVAQTRIQVRAEVPFTKTRDAYGLKATCPQQSRTAQATDSLNAACSRR